MVGSMSKDEATPVEAQEVYSVQEFIPMMGFTAVSDAGHGEGPFSYRDAFAIALQRALSCKVKTRVVGPYGRPVDIDPEIEIKANVSYFGGGHTIEANDIPAEDLLWQDDKMGALLQWAEYSPSDPYEKDYQWTGDGEPDSDLVKVFDPSVPRVLLKDRDEVQVFESIEAAAKAVVSTPGSTLCYDGMFFSVRDGEWVGHPALVFILEQTGGNETNPLWLYVHSIRAFWKWLAHHKRTDSALEELHKITDPKKYENNHSR